MNTVAITDLDNNVCNWKSDLPQVNFSCSLTPPEITRQRNFKLTDIEYDLKKYEIASMGRVEYKNAIIRNVIKVDDVEVSANL